MEIYFSFNRRKFDRIGFDSGVAGALWWKIGSSDGLCLDAGGLAYGCKFCASGLEGFSRNLCANEIADQLTAVERATGEKIDNIVFMGMGEPLANLENGPWTIWIINAEWSPRYRPAPHYDLNQRVSAADSQTG